MIPGKRIIVPIERERATTAHISFQKIFIFENKKPLCLYVKYDQSYKYFNFFME